jgi:hypothetical protein
MRDLSRPPQHGGPSLFFSAALVFAPLLFLGPELFLPAMADARNDEQERLMGRNVQ